MFRGEYTHKMEENGGIIVPIQFRKELGERVMLQPSSDGCLLLYPDNGNGIEVKKLGRIVIPKPLRKYAGLEKEVVFAGCGQLIEVWDAERWKIEWEKTRAEIKEIIEEEVERKEKE